MNTPIRIVDVIRGALTPETAYLELLADNGPLQLEMARATTLKVLELAVRLQVGIAPVPGQHIDVNAFDTEWWTLGTTQNGADIILTLQLEGGGNLGFRIPMDQAERLAAAFPPALQQARELSGQA